MQSVQKILHIVGLAFSHKIFNNKMPYYYIGTRVHCLILQASPEVFNTAKYMYFYTDERRISLNEAIIKASTL